MVRKKITIVGAGKVGSTALQLIAYKGLGDIVLWNRTEGKAKGLVLDLLESAPIEGFDSKITGTGSFEDTKDSDIIVVTAGAQRKEGQSRDELLFTNADIIKHVTENLANNSPNAIFMIVTNPVDVMTCLAYKVSGFPKNRVFGMAGVLDSARFRSFVSERLKVSPKQVSALVLGSHGDLMLPLISHANVGGTPLTKLLPKEEIDKLVERTRKGGAEIISLMESSAFYTPGSAIAQTVEYIVKDKKMVLPSIACLEGEYGLKDVFVGVPVKLGRNGVEEIVEMKLSDDELSQLKASAEKIKAMVGKLEEKGYC